MDQYASMEECLAGLLEELDPALWKGLELWLGPWLGGEAQ